MLHSVKDLDGYELAASDGLIGHVREVYFDDQRWVVRHLVVDTGGWLSGRQVLVSPHAVRGVDRAARRLDLVLARKQVEDAPGIETDRPVDRQHEAAAYDYYGYPYYWGGSGLWGMMDMPLGGAIAPYTLPEPGPEADALRERAAADAAAADPHLRSSQEVIGYAVQARDGDIGHVNDFLFDAQSWAVRLIVVDTHNWLPDRLVLVPPNWIDAVDWSERRASFKVTRQALESSPRYEPKNPVAADEVQHIQRHFEGMT